jgi:hypothetical protein
MNSTWTLEGWKLKYEGFLYKFQSKISFGRGLQIVIDGFKIENDTLQSYSLKETFAVSTNVPVHVP